MRLKASVRERKQAARKAGKCRPAKATVSSAVAGAAPAMVDALSRMLEEALAKLVSLSESEDMTPACDSKEPQPPHLPHPRAWNSPPVSAAARRVKEAREQALVRAASGRGRAPAREGERPSGRKTVAEEMRRASRHFRMFSSRDLCRTFLPHR